MTKKKAQRPSGTVHATEQWLHATPAAIAAVRKGLAEAGQGKTRYLGSFAPYAKDASTRAGS